MWPGFESTSFASFMVTDSLLDLFKANSTGNYAFKPRNTLVSCKVFHPILFQWLVLGSSLALRFISCSNRENRSLALLKMAMSQKRKHEDLRMLDLVIATRENTAKLGYFVDDTVVNPGLGIPYYKTVTWTPLFLFWRCPLWLSTQTWRRPFWASLEIGQPTF